MMKKASPSLIRDRDVIASGSEPGCGRGVKGETLQGKVSRTVKVTGWFMISVVKPRVLRFNENRDARGISRCEPAGNDGGFV